MKSQKSKVKSQKCVNSRSGFTLIEMIVSLGIFTITLFIATSALLSVVNADRKSRATRIATDNLNLTLENMTRKIKTGSKYYCGADITGATLDCPTTPNTAFSFTDQTGINRVVYQRAVGAGVVTTGAGCGTGFKTTQGCILRSDSGVFTLVTSPEIDITGLSFRVSGSAPWTDTVQPFVIIAIDGVIGANSTNKTGRSAFKIQTTLTQRAYDH